MRRGDGRRWGRIESGIEKVEAEKVPLVASLDRFVGSMARRGVFRLVLNCFIRWSSIVIEVS